MAQDINTVVVIGNITKDVELKDVGSSKVASISLAVNDSVKKGDKWEQYANFFDISLFGKRAEALAPYLTKGKKIAVTGKLRQQRWEKDGQKNSKVVIMAEDVELLGGKSDEKSSSGSAPASSSGSELPEDSIPF